jgi:hypothetical protein
MRKARKWGWLAGTVLLATACMGPFNWTGQVHHWNDKVTDNKWLNELVFLGLVIFPVYELSLFADAIVFNSVEFWTGKNWISKPGS